MLDNEINNYADAENDMIVEDTYVVIDLYSRPLKKHRYRSSEVVHRAAKSFSPLVATAKHSPGMRTATQLSAQDADTSVGEQDIPPTAPKQTSAEEENYYDLGSRILSEVPEEFLNPQSSGDYSGDYDGYQGYTPTDGNDAETPADAKKPKKVSLRIKLRKALYDYSEIQQEELEQQIEELINQDGFYNEVVPVDVGEDYNEKNGIIDKRVAVIFGLLIALSVALVYMIKTF